MRTAYQGKQFEFIPKAIKKPNVKTIDDLIRLNYSFVIAKTTVADFEGLDFYKATNKIITETLDLSLQENIKSNSKIFFVFLEDSANPIFSYPHSLLPEILRTNIS